MMLTVDEAVKINCPVMSLARISDTCVGDGCMMWRWAQKPNPEWKPGNSISQFPARDTRSDPPMYIEDRTRGYCGLAGRP